MMRTFKTTDSDLSRFLLVYHKIFNIITVQTIWLHTPVLEYIKMSLFCSHI